jgi:hypothetical protein
MKKVLATAAALGLVIGAATAASAYDLTMKGKYVVEGYYLSDTTDNAGAGFQLNGTNTNSDAYYVHTMQIKPTMKVNDNITMKGDIRLFKESAFGDSDDTGADETSSDQLDIDKIYMEYKSPVGKFRIGRVPAGAWMSKYLDNASNGNRIMWWPSFLENGPWSVMLYTQKNQEYDVGTEATAGNTTSDADTYTGDVYYKTDATKAALRYSHGSNKEGEGVDEQYIAAYLKHKVNDWTIEAELMYQFGEDTATVDWDAWGVMIDATGKFDATTAGLMYFYASGDNNSGDSDNEALLSKMDGTGDDFKPLYILTGDHTDLFNTDTANFTGNSAHESDIEGAGVHALVLHADYKASDKLTLHGALGYALADEEAAGWDDDYGWELNVGAAYKLLDNLTYEAHFGYLDTGDFFKEGNAATQTNDVYILSHHLTMKF